MKKIFATHPLVQMLSFSIILIGSSSFGGPYLFFVIGSVIYGGAYGITGLAGMICTLISLYKPLNKPFQIAGLLLMWISLGICFYLTPTENWVTTFGHILPTLTVLLFIAVSCTILLKHFHYDFKRL